MQDLINRQAAIEAICKEGTRLERNGTVAKGRMEDKTVKSSRWVLGGFLVKSSTLNR